MLQFKIQNFPKYVGNSLKKCCKLKANHCYTCLHNQHNKTLFLILSHSGMVVVLLAAERKVQKSGKAAFGGKNNEPPGQKVLAVPHRLTYHQQHTNT